MPGPEIMLIMIADDVLLHGLSVKKLEPDLGEVVFVVSLGNDTVKKTEQVVRSQCGLANYSHTKKKRRWFIL